MKIHVGKPETQFIQGYTPVIIAGGDINLNGISDNECDEILANEVCDEFPIEQVGQVMEALLSKLRLGGKITIGGTDAYLFARAITDGSLPEQEYCTVIRTRQSLTNVNTVADTIRQLGMTVDVFDTNGVYYEVTASRRQM